MTRRVGALIFGAEFFGGLERGVWYGFIKLKRGVSCETHNFCTYCRPRCMHLFFYCSEETTHVYTNSILMSIDLYPHRIIHIGHVENTLL